MGSKTNVFVIPRLSRTQGTAFCKNKDLGSRVANEQGSAVHMTELIRLNLLVMLA